MKLKWMGRTRRDLDWICGHIEQHNPMAAWRISQDIRACASRLSDFPHLGKASDEIGVRFLQVARRPYLLTYRLSDQSIEILTVFDQRRDPEDML